MDRVLVEIRLDYFSKGLLEPHPESWNGNNWAEFLYAAKGNQKKSIKPRFTRGSPERQRGLADATARTSRIKKFTLAEAINFLLKYDPIGIFFLCWVIGFGGWWALLPQEALTQPSVCLDPQYVNLFF